MQIILLMLDELVDASFNFNAYNMQESLEIMDMIHSCIHFIPSNSGSYFYFRSQSFLLITLEVRSVNTVATVASKSVRLSITHFGYFGCNPPHLVMRQY